MSEEVKREKSLTMTMLMTPDKANFSGKNVHGGEILKMLDHVAYACAARYTGMYAVTLSVDMVLFKDPIKIGSLVTFHASVNYTGRTSMEIGIKVISEDIKDHTIKNTNVCYFTMIAVDENGKPAAVPKLELVTEDDKRRYNDAIARREMRMASRHSK
ncbi:MULTISPECIES: acyl-CoA thioesterase [Arcobacter]|uniref:Acyl-CoA thioesterase n=2 Tax=Arcobacter TaxID=28196 RepID=A0AAE7B3R9_9BACT|nr:MULTISPECIES: acyl-CoA thioesterase [Arcobacter]MCB9097303.1 acyl-CoA thioesterase [Arcobacter sp.]NCB12970.1 acyl-CoA thioesterase [Erysipelotrichia bacterium]QKE25911.1 acyl-CoA thioesterase [Arcobacter aquimarinus]RXI35589.1 acyl-CoA thioesterase [Arcobacter aquimarinus]RXJ85477.1 acyl-CoA thioesterase [Arcobacter cloacae]